MVKELLKLIDFCFNGGNKNYIKINDWGNASWGKKTKNSVGFTKNSLKVAVKHLIENCYFTVGNTVLRQAIGIPMGIDRAPFWANLFLYAYEASYISELIDLDKVKARHFHSTKRFIDDLCALNDGGEFCRVYKNIYPNELELNSNTQVPMHHSLTSISPSKRGCLYTNYSINVTPFLFQSYVCLTSPVTSRRAFSIVQWWENSYALQGLHFYLKIFFQKLVI